MKLNNTDNQHLTSLNKPATEFSVAVNGNTFKIITNNLYSDPIQAIIREITFNAIDAHNAIGKGDVPVLLTLPSAAYKMFEVEDFGPGMSDEEIRVVYTTYFKSTKNDSNDLVGGFGLGSKTPLAYNDAFTVESTQNHITKTYLISINAEGVPVLQLMREHNNAEKESGFKVSVPVKEKDIEKWSDKIYYHHMFAFAHTPVMNVVDNVLLPRDTKVLEELDSKGYSLYFNPSSPALTAIIGGNEYGISYSVTAGLDEYSKFREICSAKAYLKFEIGELDLEASRDGLYYSDRTIAAIGKKVHDMSLKVDAELNNIVNDSSLSLVDRAIKLQNRGAKHSYIAAIIGLMSESIPKDLGNEYVRLYNRDISVNKPSIMYMITSLTQVYVLSNSSKGFSSALSLVNAVDKRHSNIYLREDLVAQYGEANAKIIEGLLNVHPLSDKLSARIEKAKQDIIAGKATKEKVKRNYGEIRLRDGSVFDMAKDITVPLEEFTFVTPRFIGLCDNEVETYFGGAEYFAVMKNTSTNRERIEKFCKKKGVKIHIVDDKNDVTEEMHKHTLQNYLGTFNTEYEFVSKLVRNVVGSYDLANNAELVKLIIDAGIVKSVIGEYVHLINNKFARRGAYSPKAVSEIKYAVSEFLKKVIEKSEILRILVDDSNISSIIDAEISKIRPDLIKQEEI